MPPYPPTKTSDAAAEKPADDKSGANTPAAAKFDPMRPEMPNIPGISHPAPGRERSGFSGIDPQRLPQIVGIAVAALLAAGVFWWIRNRPRADVNPSSDSEIADQNSPVPDVPAPTPQFHEGPTVAATVEELSKPWAAKKFTFVNPLTQESTPAMVIRLPNGEYWAFSLQGPFGRCQLEYIADPATVAAKYGYNAAHPMVVSPCDNTVYDPLRVGPLGGNTWARGEIVRGSSLRPPIAIDVKVRGKSIIADNIE